MTQPRETTLPGTPNGSGAAAMLAAAIGCFALGVLAAAGDKSAAIKSSMNFYRPTGPLSGVTTLAIALWLCAWGVMEWRWRSRSLPMDRMVAAAALLLGLGLLLTFPPVVDLL